MKTTISMIFIFCCTLIKSQTTTDLNIKDIDNTQSVSMALLDNSPNIIFTNFLPKKATFNTTNLSNISFEVTPFYYFDKRKYEGYEFFGLKDTLNTFIYTNKGFHNLSKITLSANAMPKDSATTVAFGVRTNILTIYNTSGKKLHDLWKNSRKSDEELDKETELRLKKKNITRPIATDPKIDDFLNKFAEEREKLNNLYLESFMNKLKNPMITLDVSGAFSSISPHNKISNFRTDRYGIWSTLALSINLDKYYTSFIKLHLFLRYLKDNYVEKNEISTSQFTDYGLKLQGVLNKNISVIYEYVKRNGDGGDYRSVGQIQYKLNDELSFNGGFGKNFEVSNTNLITFLGISWGFVNNPKTKNK